MFAGRQRRSSNIKFIQLFHELKQRFPTVPDHIVSSYITTHVIQSNNAQDKPSIVEYIESTLAENNGGADGGDQMGRPASQHLDADAVVPRDDARPETTTGDEHQRDDVEMMTTTTEEARPKRPDRLEIRPEAVDANDFGGGDFAVDERGVSAKKLLGVVSEKPPRSPLSFKRFAGKAAAKCERTSPDLRSPSAVQRTSPAESLGAVKRRPWSVHGVPDEAAAAPDDEPSPSPRRKSDDVSTAAKKETCSTPTQTTDTLLGSPNLNLSLNVNLDLHQKREGAASPSRPWMQQQPPSPRSITSVNLTVRSPTKSPQERQADAQDGSEQQVKANRWQITVIPSGGRVRPRSYHPQESRAKETTMAARTGSLDNLVAAPSEPPVILKQKARLERLRSELNNEHARLERVKREIHELEKSRYVLDLRIDKDFKKQLEMEVRHLMSQCKELEFDTGLDEEFYNNIYTGQQGPLAYNFAPSQRLRRQSSQRLQPHRSPPDIEGPKWNCGVCTFLNHPDLDKCEQCEMPRIVHGTRLEAVNPNVTFGTLQMLNHLDRSVSVGNVVSGQSYAGYDPRTMGYVVGQGGQPMSLPPHIVPSHSAPNMLSRLLRRSGT